MKRVIRYISEIVFAFVLIFVSYFAWDRIDVEAYEKYITQYNLEDVQIVMDNDFQELAFLSDEEFIDDTVLCINNFQNKVYNADIFLVLSNINVSMSDDLFLNINGENYCLKDIYSKEINDEYYFLISNIELDEYEKVNYNLKLLVSDDYNYEKWTDFSYRIQKEIKG